MRCNIKSYRTYVHYRPRNSGEEDKESVAWNGEKKDNSYDVADCDEPVEIKMGHVVLLEGFVSQSNVDIDDKDTKHQYT